MTWATSVPILVFLGLSVLDLGPTYATDVGLQTSDRRQSSDAHRRLMPPPYGAGHNKERMQNLGGGHQRVLRGYVIVLSQSQCENLDPLYSENYNNNI